MYIPNSIFDYCFIASLCKPTPQGIKQPACPARVKHSKKHNYTSCTHRYDDNGEQSGAENGIPMGQDKRCTFGKADIEEFEVDNFDDLRNTGFYNIQRQNVRKVQFLPEYDNGTMINHYQGRPAVTEEAWAVFKALQLQQNRKNVSKQQKKHVIMWFPHNVCVLNEETPINDSVQRFLYSDSQSISFPRANTKTREDAIQAYKNDIGHVHIGCVPQHICPWANFVKHDDMRYATRMLATPTGEVGNQATDGQSVCQGDDSGSHFGTADQIRITVTGDEGTTPVFKINASDDDAQGTSGSIETDVSLETSDLVLKPSATTSVDEGDTPMAEVKLRIAIPMCRSGTISMMIQPDSAKREHKEDACAAIEAFNLEKRIMADTGCGHDLTGRSSAENFTHH